MWFPRHSFLSLSNSILALNYKHSFHNYLFCAYNGQALLYVLGMLLETTAGTCPEGMYVLSQLANKILQLLLLGLQFVTPDMSFEGFGFVLYSF